MSWPGWNWVETGWAGGAGWGGPGTWIRLLGPVCEGIYLIKIAYIEIDTHNRVDKFIYKNILKP